MTKYLFIALLLLSIGSLAQVKIGGAPGAAHPSAVLELNDTARGFLLPRLTQAQMAAIATPPDGLMIYNTTHKNTYQYKAAPAQWQPVSTDSSEWIMDSAAAKLYLRRGLANGDTIYYNVAKRRFIFTDTRFLGTSASSSLFNIDEGSNDKFVIKMISSQIPKDTGNGGSSALYVAHEVDNEPAYLSRPYESAYFGIANSTVINRRVTQRVGIAYGVYTTLTNGAQDTVSSLVGISNFVVGRSRAYTQSMTGLQNNVQFSDSALANVGTVFGIRNTLSFNATGTVKVDGNYIGYQGTMPSLPNNRVLGNAYGILLGNVTLAPVGNNFAINTSRGYNRLGDSTVVTDIFAIRPRAIFDINATSAMILPVGNNAQRPAAPITGMLRYNTDAASPEAYTGAAWVNLKSPILSATAVLDCPNIATNSTVTITYTFPGAAVGNVVAVSPAAALPSGLSIAWARVNNPNELDICFGNYSGALLNPPAQTFYIKVIQ
jgi:hypothetical protein